MSLWLPIDMYLVSAGAAFSLYLIGGPLAAGIAGLVCAVALTVIVFVVGEK